MLHVIVSELARDIATERSNRANTAKNASDNNGSDSNYLTTNFSQSQK